MCQLSVMTLGCQHLSVYFSCLEHFHGKNGDLERVRAAQSSTGKVAEPCSQRAGFIPAKVALFALGLRIPVGPLPPPAFLGPSV